MADQVRWFDSLGSCGSCGKSATGLLRGPRNESYGAYCLKCADRRLKKAERERAAEAGTNPGYGVTVPDQTYDLKWRRVARGEE
jgi:hypothetical protein